MAGGRAAPDNEFIIHDEAIKKTVGVYAAGDKDDRENRRQHVLPQYDGIALDVHLLDPPYIDKVGWQQENAQSSKKKDGQSRVTVYIISAFLALFCGQQASC
jgi:hypothetical protein